MRKKAKAHLAERLADDKDVCIKIPGKMNFSARYAKSYLTKSAFDDVPGWKA